MLRDEIKNALKKAMAAKDKLTVTTLRMILAAIKDKDIALRAKNKEEAINEMEILSLLQTMIKQRKESIKSYETGGRPDLVKKEQDEIQIIKNFLPKQMNDEEIQAAISKILKTIDAPSIKAMGQIMSALKKQYTGQMDFAKASQILKAHLSSQTKK